VDAVFDGLTWYLYLVIIITFHECGHAWMSWKCGDDTARLQGRVTLNPIAHIDPIGTVLLPALIIGLSAANSGLANFIIGWGKPVPVNVHKLRHPNRDDLLVAMAGPAMNVGIAFAAMGLARVGVLMQVEMMLEMGKELAFLSMFLCFFNLLPVPPLDGSYLMRHLIGMSHETFFRISRYGFFIVIVLINLDPVRRFLLGATLASMSVMRSAWFF